uniref:SGNH hydrolase-type esterase domain-containing protein n=2 Tax=Odontella aurita TaxID=265563 RepID=A0A7S4JXD0_9STRA|mmetsp:Transcript_56512/g.169044  ORF Transcript_56512/g.169044 Transcript_56512/m.169044 type:complete len:258 (+) Transcript_56512:141-914(+)
MNINETKAISRDDNDVAGLDSRLTPTVYTGAEFLCYGDSLTAGYCSPEFAPYADALSESLGGAAVDHAGMSGWTAERMVRRADSDRESAFGLVYPGLRRLVRCRSGRRYSVVILMAGTNDLGFVPAEAIAANLARLHSMCHDAGVNTVAVTVPQSAFASDVTARGRLSLREKQREVNDLLRDFAADANSGSGSSRERRCLFVDMESRVPWSEGSADWMSDGLHMSKAGYEKFGRLLGPLISNFVEGAKRGEERKPSW